MENSGRVFFDDDQAHWYLALGPSHIGPLTASDIYAKIIAREVTWAHYVWRPGEKSWQRICDIATFQVALPQKPSQALPGALRPLKGAASKGKKTQVEAPAHPPRKGPARSSSAGAQGKTKSLMLAPGPSDRIWFLFYNHSQFGPFSKDEVNRLLLIGRVHGKVHTWRNGMKGWERLERIPEFKDTLSTASELPELQTVMRTRELGPKTKGGGEGDSRFLLKSAPVKLSRDKRVAPRAPLVAKIVMADDQGVTVGICRDISIGGMQILTDRVPGKMGSRIRLNVSAIGDDPSRPKIESFVAEGVIVRILEDNRGFSFRFEKLSVAARRAIQQYIDLNA